MNAVQQAAYRFEIRDAVEADNAGLLELTRATPMAGTISLRIDRDPDFFALLRMRGDARVFVATHGAQVVGCVSVALRPAFVSGRLETVAYAGDLKIHPYFAGNRLVPRLVAAAVDYLRSRGVDLLLSIVADGNRRPISFFEAAKGKPPSVAAGRFFVEELIAAPLATNGESSEVGPAKASDIPAVGALLDQAHRAREFAPNVSTEELTRFVGTGGADKPRQVFVARENGRIVATLRLFDPALVKTNVLVGAPILMRGALALLRTTAASLSGLPVPRIGEAVRLLYACDLACADGHAGALRRLLRRARAEAFHRRCSFVVLGLHERDALRAVVSGSPRFTFVARAFVTSLRDSSSRLSAVAAGVPYEDFALV